MSSFINVLVIALAATGSVLALPTSSSTTSKAPVATPDTRALYSDLFTSPTALGRYQRLLVDPATTGLLPADALRSRIAFDYNAGAQLKPGDKGGKVTAAVAATFPILVKEGISTVAAFFTPCSLLVPHTHPQTESLVVTQGTLTTGTLIPGLVGPGQGTGEIVQTLSTYQGTVFPAGSIHYQLNPTCYPATFVASLPSSDPGTTLESSFFFINGSVVSTTLGFPEGAVDGRDINTIRNKIPQGVIIAVEQCLAKCGLKKRS